MPTASTGSFVSDSWNYWSGGARVALPSKGCPATVPTVLRKTSFLLALLTLLLSSTAWSYEVPRPLDEVLRDWNEQAASPSGALLIPELAGLWDHEDPEEVLAALARVASDRRAPPWTVGYYRWAQGSLLLRLGRVEEAREVFDELGFVQEWMVVGPFDNDNEAGFDRAFPPEESLGSALDMTATYEGRFRPVTWRQYPSPPHPDGATVLGTIMEPHEASCAYLATVVQSNRPVRAALRLGFDGAARVWLNGVSVYDDDGNRSAVPDRAATGVMLQRGRNQLVVKSCNVSGPWDVFIRLTQATGRPLTGVTVSADATALGAAPARGRDPFETPSFWSYFFEQAGGEERILSPGDDDAEGDVAEVPARAYAELSRFLTLFGGDDPSEHVARDAAQAAVDAEASVDNLRLLARLHPDRNRRLAALNRALELDSDNIRVLMALAGERSGGAHVEDALVYVGRVEQLDNENLYTRLARIDVLSEFGFEHTALARARALAEQRPVGRVLAVLRGAANHTGNRALEEETTRRFFAFHQNSGSIRIELARRLAERQENEAAIELLRAGLAFSPTSSSFRGELATLFEASDQDAAALEQRREAIALRPDDGELHEALAHLLDRLGREDEAVVAARRSLELRPENPWLRQWLSVVSREERFEGPYVEEDETFLARRGQGAGHDVRTLLDLTVRKVHQSGQSDEFRQLIFEAVTLQGARDLSAYRMAFTPHRQRLRVERARVYRPDGATREDVGRSTRDVYDPSIRMYYDLRVTTISFGDIQPGDVVEIRYRISDVGRSNELGNYFGELTLFQTTTPRARVAYVLLAPTDRPLYFNEPDFPGLEHRVNRQGQEVEHVFEALNVPAISAENGMPPLAEVAPTMLASTYNSWEELGRWYWTLVRDQLELDSGQRQRAEELVEGASTDLEKVRAIHRHVVQSVRYVALEFGVHRFKPYRVSDIERRGFGDCKDQASLMIAMLEHVGVEAEIVLLRTRHLGRVATSPPSLEVFNHAIVYVPSIDTYIDPTAERVAVGDLPSGDQGVMTLRVRGNDVTFTNTPLIEPQLQTRRLRLTLALTADGTARGALAMETTGWLAGASRARLDDPSNRENYMETLLSRYMRGVRVADVTTTDTSELDSDTQVDANLEVPGFARREGDDLSFAVSIAPSLTGLVTLPERQYDLVVGPPMGWIEEIDIEIPPGFTSTNLPEPIEVTSPLATFRLSVSHARGGPVQLRSTLLWRAERITPEQYAGLRQLVEEITQARMSRVRLVSAGGVQ